MYCTVSKLVSLALKEEQRFRLFENKVLRKIVWPKRDEITVEWKKLQYSELHALYSSPNIIRNLKLRRLRRAEHVARMEPSSFSGKTREKETFRETETWMGGQY